MAPCLKPKKEPKEMQNLYSISVESELSNSDVLSCGRTPDVVQERGLTAFVIVNSSKSRSSETS